MRRSTRPEPLLFYGYSADVIARWCCVSRRTALAYKRGSRVPSFQTVRLFVLHRDMQVVPVEWGRGWRLGPLQVTTPEGVSIPHNWIRQYQLLIQWSKSIARDGGRLREWERRVDRFGSQP